MNQNGTLVSQLKSFSQPTPFDELIASTTPLNDRKSSLPTVSQHSTIASQLEKLDFYSPDLDEDVYSLNAPEKKVDIKYVHRDQPTRFESFGGGRMGAKADTKSGLFGPGNVRQESQLAHSAVGQFRLAHSKSGQLGQSNILEQMRYPHDDTRQQRFESRIETANPNARMRRSLAYSNERSSDNGSKLFAS